MHSPAIQLSQMSTGCANAQLDDTHTSAMEAGVLTNGTIVLCNNQSNVYDKINKFACRYSFINGSTVAGNHIRATLLAL